MARSRNIKPGFFKNYELADAGPGVQLLFAGLWCLADRAGRLEDKPRLIKAEIFPYYEFNVNAGLTELQRLGLVDRYVVNGFSVVLVCNFNKHQTPHNTEKASSLPPPPPPPPKTSIESTACIVNGGLTVDSRKPNGGKTPDSLLLIPDSGFLIPDSLLLIPDSLNLFGTPLAEAAPEPAKLAKITKPPKDPAPSRAAWQAYAGAYFRRYGAEPVRNATVNGQLSQLVGRIGAMEAPHVAAWYVQSRNSFYVQSGHSVGILLRDCEKLRTEWATGHQVTQTQAIQGDRSQTNLNAFAGLLSEAKQNKENHAEH